MHRQCILHISPDHDELPLSDDIYVTNFNFYFINQHPGHGNYNKDDSPDNADGLQHTLILQAISKSGGGAAINVIKSASVLIDDKAVLFKLSGRAPKDTFFAFFEPKMVKTLYDSLKENKKIEYELELTGGHKTQYTLEGDMLNLSAAMFEACSEEADRLDQGKMPVGNN